MKYWDNFTILLLKKHLQIMLRTVYIIPKISEFIQHLPSDETTGRNEIVHSKVMRTCREGIHWL
jgi:hypothetical protein